MSPEANSGFSYQEQLGDSAVGMTVVEYLAKVHLHSSAQEWQARIERGEVKLDGRLVLPSEILGAGQSLAWTRPGWIEEPVSTRFEVIYEADDLLVVNKPSGLPTLPGGGFLENTLTHRVKLRDPAWDPMHRLGRGTSGLVVFARGDVRSEVQRSIRERRIRKTYLALATGAVAAPQVVQVPIGPVPHPLLGEVHAASSTGKPSETRILRSDPRGADSRLEIDLVTGRPHQIRIHLASIGHPLVGDPLYWTGCAVNPASRPGELGYSLHAWRLSLIHPSSGERLDLEAAPPAGLA